jgi:hypothetical protein
MALLCIALAYFQYSSGYPLEALRLRQAAIIFLVCLLGVSSGSALTSIATILERILNELKDIRRRL